MISPLLSVLDQLVDSRPQPWSLVDVHAALPQVLGACARMSLSDPVVPYGRYLLHLDGAGRYNVQLDVFSPEYVGGIHCHGSWGIFTVLRGTLYAEEFDPGASLRTRVGAYAPGSGAGFASPDDWHRVSTGAGPQVVSIHVYGAGFDLDEGEAIGAGGERVRYRRSPFGHPFAIRGLFR